MRISDWSSDVCSSDLNVVDTLKRINGVGDADLFGALNYSMRVWLDPDKLTSFQLTPAEVAAAIRTQNIQAAVGRVGAAPLNPDPRTEGHTSELQSLMRNSYAVFCLEKKVFNLRVGT